MRCVCKVTAFCVRWIEMIGSKRTVAFENRGVTCVALALTFPKEMPTSATLHSPRPYRQPSLIPINSHCNAMRPTAALFARSVWKGVYFDRCVGTVDANIRTGPHIVPYVSFIVLYCMP